jgi:aminoglycoside phosphotransferase (APT) family kinase protein
MIEADVGFPGQPDVVASYADVQQDQLAPLIVLEGLETFLVSRGGSRYVLRRPPRPPWPPRAHDVAREFAVLSALGDTGLPVPRPLTLCADASAIGAPFYLMEYVDGVVIRDSFPAQGFDAAGDRREAMFALARTLADIHAVDWAATTLSDLSPRTGYVDRQLRRFRELWERNKTRAVPEVDALGAWLLRNQPPTREVTLVHGDYKLDNAIFARHPPARLVAVLDWEMAAIGDPLADVGLLSASWVEPGQDRDPLLGFSAAAAAPGCPTRAELLAEYARRSQRSLEHLRWYECLAIWKIAVILEGGYKRYLAGTTNDPFFERVREGVPRVARNALALAERAQAPSREGAMDG